MRIPKPIQYVLYIAGLAVFSSVSLAGMLTVAERLPGFQIVFDHGILDMAFFGAALSVFIFIQVVIANITVKQLSLRSLFLLSVPSALTGQLFLIIAETQSSAGIIFGFLGFILISWGFPIVILRCRDQAQANQVIKSTSGETSGSPVRWYSIYLQKSLGYQLLAVGIISAIAFAFLHAAPPRIPRGFRYKEGSLRHARLWREMLLDCNSPADVRDRFNCVKNSIDSDGRYTSVRESETFEKDKPWALLYEFGNGNWMAVAFANSHSNDPARGTVVARDSNGAVRVYFGHVCGQPDTFGDSIAEIYSEFSLRSRTWKEIPISELIEQADSLAHLRRP
jgi:hypothetical protein